MSKSDDYSKKKGKGEIEVVPVPEEDKPKPKEDKDKEGGDEGVKEEKKDKDVLSLREQRKLELKQKKLVGFALTKVDLAMIPNRAKVT